MIQIGLEGVLEYVSGDLVELRRLCMRLACMIKNGRMEKWEVVVADKATIGGQRCGQSTH